MMGYHAGASLFHRVGRSSMKGLHLKFTGPSRAFGACGDGDPQESPTCIKKISLPFSELKGAAYEQF